MYEYFGKGRHWQGYSKISGWSMLSTELWHFTVAK
jgi:hypothetical protein